MNLYWDLDEALVFIRTLQPICMECGYYVALAGGVLNKGHSSNDLDLVLVPRTAESNLTLIETQLNHLWGHWTEMWMLPSAKGLSYIVKDKTIEFAVIL